MNTPSWRTGNNQAEETSCAWGSDTSEMRGFKGQALVETGGDVECHGRTKGTPREPDSGSVERRYNKGEMRNRFTEAAMDQSGIGRVLTPLRL